MRYEKDLKGNKPHTESYIHGFGLESKETTNTWGEKKKNYYSHNELGSVTREYNQEGNTTNSYEYDLFGVPSFREDTHSYTSYTHDQSTGLMYAQARYYLPEVGRFISEDSYKGTLPDPESQNRYVYCVSNPLRYVDPSGHIAKWLEYIPGVGAVVYTGEGVYCLITGKEPDGGWEAWSDRTFNAGINTFFAALIMYDLGIGTTSITFGKGTDHFGKSSGKPVTGIVNKPNLKLVSEKSTGRYVPNNLKEQLAMEQVKANPNIGKVLSKPLMSDSKNGWYAKDGWVKMTQNVNNIEIHYIKNMKTGEVLDFKFK